MKHPRNFLLALLAVFLFWDLAGARAAETRLALVVGNANYAAGALPTPANDAGLIAQTLQAAGFDVVGVRDLDQDSLRRTFRDFIAKVSAAGPDTVAFVYLGGYGLQLEGENYFVPTDANIARDVNVSAEALRLSDYTKPLAALGIKASILVLDAARANPFAKSGPPLAGGLTLVEPAPGTLIAFNAAPGTVAQNEAGPYSSYAQALAEMMREGGLPVTDLFNRIRLRVNEITKGAQVPWDASKLQAPFHFFERAPDAPPPQVSPEQTSSLRSKPIGDLDARDAYLAALDRDNLRDYEKFLAAYPDDPMARRVRAIVAARREAITWRRSRSVDTPSAYWSYLRRYPNGSHANDARRRLAYLTAALEPPPRFEIISYDVLPPPPEEIIYVERPILIFDDPDFGFEPPPPPPIVFLPPRPVYFVELAPPPPPVYAYVLPVPIYVPVPVWVHPPRYIAPPPNNIIYNNIHNRVVVNNAANTVTITKPGGQAQTLSPPAQPPASQPQPPIGGVKSAPGAVAPAALLAPSLPPSVAPKAIPVQNTAPVNALPGQTGPVLTPPVTGRPPVAGQPLPAPSQPGQVPPPGQTPPPGQAAKTLPGQPLPGAGGQPLPPVSGKPPVAGQPPVAPSQPGQVPPPGQTPPPGQAAKTLPGQPLPGAGGQPLPPVSGKPPVAGPPPVAPLQPGQVQPPGQTPPPGQAAKTLPGQPLPGAGGQPLPPVGAKPPVAGQPQPSSPPATRPTSPPPPPPVVRAPPPPPPAVRVPPPPPVMRAPPPPPVVRAPPPPPAVRAPPPPPVVRAPPPPPVMRAPPPPPPVVRAPPPPPVVRAPPPPPVVRAPPPPPVVRAPPPPPVVRAPPPPPPVARQAPAAKPCVPGQPCR
jgi:uncharacterized caspase-like protein